ncbi:hybrid sensor histidine kinase/response regulator [Pseudoalteromonas phenolica]|uniref:histidine kinase n=1 Tax=Pseudoalteromonas phenolica TaxID=161398 RepID=A0A5R9Q4G5_9GAMM|nr:PAS domain-containing hybrid sensor histidine kinase/response regulator [Pseudoalteromonas phenolica]TLX48043.1 hybrid sensor histidine kinase/response regulator [Pseudoalteromonas phenolica]
MDKWINGTIQDCTFEKLAILSLNDANESKQLAIEAGKIGTWRSTKDTHDWLWSWDLQANQIFKMNPEDIGNLDKWVQRLHPEDKERVLTSLEHSLLTGEEFKEHYRGILNNNELIYVFAQGRVGTDPKGVPCRIDGVCIDQTEIFSTQKALKELNMQLESRVIERTEELHKTLEKAENANKIKSEFLSMISHELRTPLNGIVGSLDLLSNNTLPADSRELVNTAYSSANHLISILNDILDLNKIEAGKIELETVSFNISQLLTEVINTFSASAFEKGIQLTIYENFQNNLTFKGDEKRLRQILLNILGNALKFTNASHIQHKQISISVHIELLNIYQSEVSIKISDTGIGMSKETISKLFTPFTQAEKSTTRKFGGTGLGLSICGKLIDLMGGEISVESILNKGSDFTVKVPMWVDTHQELLTKQHKIIFYHIGSPSDNNQYLQKLIESNNKTQECSNLDKITNLHTSFDYLILLVSNINQLKKLHKKIELLEKAIVFVEPKDYENLSIELPHLALTVNQPITLTSFEQLLKDSNQDDFFLKDLSITEFSSALISNENDSTNSKHDVLLVEDNHLNQKLLKSQLAKLGIECDVANNGKEGLIHWRNHDYKLILTDCHMPELDGYEMTQNIRTEEALLEKQPVPIIAVSGAVMKGEKELCTSIGMNDFLSKPVKLSEIKLIMERWYEQPK